MSPLPHTRVGLNPWFGGFFFCVAAFNIYVYAITHDGMQLALGVLMTLIGGMYVFGTLLVIDGPAVELKNPLGITMRTYPFASPADLTIEGRTLWVTTAAGRKKVSGLLASGPDWRALAAAIAAAQGGDGDDADAGN